MKLLEFLMCNGEDGTATSHFEISASKISVVLDKTVNICGGPYLQADDVKIIKLKRNGKREDFTPSVIGYPVCPEMAFLDIVSRLSANNTKELKVLSISAPLQEFIQCFDSCVATKHGERNIPFFVTNGRQLLHLVLATSRFLYYKNDFDEAFMYRIEDGVMLSCNEFADMAIIESEHRIASIDSNEKEIHFQSYKLKDFLARIHNTSLNVVQVQCENDQRENVCQRKDATGSETVVDIPF